MSTAHFLLVYYGVIFFVLVVATYKMHKWGGE